MFFQVLWQVLISSDLWQASLQFGALLLLPAIGGVVSERSGVVNIAMEGMMLTGAYAGVMVTAATNNVWIGLVGAIIAGGLMALLHAMASINFKANQIVSGMAINIGGLGLTNFLLTVQTQGNGAQALSQANRLPSLNWAPLSHLPFIGPVLFQQNLVFYLALVILVIMQFVLFRTNVGLRVRAVGEHPLAADTAGVNVRLVRYVCVVTSGLLSGLAGAFLSLGVVGSFNENMTSGTGYIALAAMIFGKYSPVGAGVACLIFGLGEALSPRLQTTGLSTNLLSALPYVLTLVALVGLVGRTTAPAADGVPYESASE